MAAYWRTNACSLARNQWLLLHCMLSIHCWSWGERGINVCRPPILCNRICQWTIQSILKCYSQPSFFNYFFQISFSISNFLNCVPWLIDIFYLPIIIGKNEICFSFLPSCAAIIDSSSRQVWWACGTEI